MLFDSSFRSRLRELFTWRRDVRRFRAEPLEEGTLERLIRLACLAPSVGLSEPWRFVVVDDEARRGAVRASFERCNAEALAGLTPDRASHYASLKLAGLYEAPCQFALFVDPDPIKGHGLGRATMPETVAYSAVMALHTIWLAARAEGIGLGWVSILDPAEIAAALDIPDHWMLIGFFCLGYPAEDDITPELEREGWEWRTSPSSVLIRR